MPSTYSPSLRIELIGAGDQSGTWGTTTNTNLGTLLEQSIAGVQAITMVDANYTLTNYNGVSDEARKAVLVVAGTNTTVRDIIAPLVTKTYTIKNNTVGGFAILIRAATGTSVSIPNGATSAVYCDGTNFNLAITQTVIAAGTGITVGVVGTTNTIGIDSTVATLTGIQTLTNKTLTAPALGTPTTLVGTNITGTAAGLSIGGNATTATTASTLNGTWNQMPAGTKLAFFQAAAPTGWTQINTYTNHMMRIVSGVGGGVGGTDSPILNNKSIPAHTHTFTGNALANHTHTDSGHTHTYTTKSTTQPQSGSATQVWWNTSTATTSTGYAQISSNSAGTPSGTNANNAVVSWTPQYLDNILCSKD